MMDKTYIYHAMKIVLPSIKYCKKIYLDRDGISFTKEKVLQGMRDGTLNSITPWPIDEKLPLDTLDSTSDAYFSRLFTKDPKRIKIRIQAHEKLIRPSKGVASKWHNSVVIHMHGGGFVAMGTRSH